MCFARLVVLITLVSPVVAGAGPERVCVVGAGISAGMFPSTRGWYTTLRSLNAGGDWGIKSVAAPGLKVGTAQPVFESDVRLRGCTWVLFMIGTNDLPDATSAAEIYDAIDSMATAAEAAGARVGLMALPPCATWSLWTPTVETKRTTVNASMQARANSLYIDISAALAEPASNPPQLATAFGGATDGLNPNDDGQDEIATTVQDAVIAEGGW